MSWGTEQYVLLIFIAVVVLVIVFLALQRFLPKLVRQRYSTTRGEDSWKEDRAANAIHSGYAVVRFLEREGIAVPEAEVLLGRAQTQLELGHYDQAIQLASDAGERMAVKRRALQQASSSGSVSSPVPASAAAASASAEPSPKTYRDLSSRVGDRDADAIAARVAAPTGGMAAAIGPTSSGSEDLEEPGADGEELPLKAAAKKLPKNFLEARFMLTSLQNDLDGASSEKRATPEGKEATEWARQSQAAFDRKDYDDSLRLALRGRRRFGGAGLSTISVGPGTVVAATPPEPSATALRSSAPQGAGSPAVVESLCPRCGKSNNAGDKFCRGCGAPLTVPKCPRCQRPTEPDDKFCHACGSPLAGAV
jgi:hypothetical protein